MNFFEYFQLYYIDQQFGLTFVITELICCLAISIIFNETNIKRWQDWLRLVIDFAVVFALDILFNCTFRTFCTLADNSAFTRYSGYFIWPALAFLHILYPRDNKKLKLKITCASAVSVFITLDIAISGTIGSMITELNGFPQTDPLKDWTMYIILFALIGTVVLFKVISPFKYRFVKNSSAVLFNVICLLGFVVPILQAAMDAGSTWFTSCLLPLLFFIIFASYGNFYITVRNYNEVLDYQTKALKAESEKNQMEISNTKYEELHRIRHDLKNQMAVLANFVKKQEYEELEKYFSDIYENTQIVIDFIDSGNTYINAVLNMELAKAKSNHLPLETHICVPNELEIEPSDLSSLLANAIDNAMEYEVKNKLTDPIDISIMYNNCLIITIKNKLAENENSEAVLKLKSSKEDRMNHGYGTKMIKTICQRYNGIAKFSVKDSYFVLDCLLMIKEKISEEELKND